MSSSLLSVLYADISGSTRLYEEFGDDAARSAVAACIAMLTEVAERFEGRVVKTIGDEVMCVFASPAKAIIAANEMQLAIHQASEEGKFVTGRLQVKIGTHHGTGVEQANEVFGEASILAQQIIKQAKADQILTSRETLQALPPELRSSSRFVDRIEAEGREGMLDVVEMIWEVSDLTQLADTQAIAPLPSQTRLTLVYGGQAVELGKHRPRLTIGRTADNDLVVPTILASRKHAEIEYRRGRFYLRDMSSNGTMLMMEDGFTHMRGERVQLHGRGTFCLGGPPEANPDGVISYDCE